MSKDEMITAALKALRDAGYAATKTPSGYLIFAGTTQIESGLTWQALYAYSLKVAR